MGITRVCKGATALGPVLACVLAGALVPGCGGKLSTEECDKLREGGFEVVNEAHTCDSDADCTPTDWPGCSKPASRKNGDRIKQLKDKFTGGKCAEPQAQCRPIPEIYCKQGLCVFREQGAAP
jgi:hypothetical protein